MPTPDDRAGPGFLAPYPLFAGIVTAFAACCAAGYLAGQRNSFDNFARFYAALSPETLYYPTARQVSALADARLEPDRIAVIVGGNSILRGCRQSRQQLWTEHLQAQLGDRYRVLNLAMDAAATTEFGAVAAEFIARKHPRYILITDFGSAGLWPDPDGSVYRYFFWDAYTKGLLPRDDFRDACVRALRRARREDEAFAELQREMQVDRFLFARDLWSALSCRRFSTVWNAPMGAGSFQARRRCPDAEHSPPAAPGARPPVSPEAMHLVRYAVEHLAPLFRPGQADQVEATLRCFFPGDERSHTLVLVTEFWPDCVGQLAPAEQEAYHAAFHSAVRGFEEHGFTALAAGHGYAPEDYIDWVHFSEQGGRKLAAEVAAKVRGMAHRLGYTTAGKN